jgi:hypothetical protein
MLREKALAPATRCIVNEGHEIEPLGIVLASQATQSRKAIQLIATSGFEGRELLSIALASGDKGAKP